MASKIIDEITFALNIPENNILEYAGLGRKNRCFYKSISIPKKNNNGFRIIYLPSAEIKQIQHFLVQRYFNRLPVHESAMAYIRGRSVVDNARSHLNNRHFLLLDIQHFFDSIDFEIFKTIVCKKRLFNSEEETILALKVCSFRGKFVQGCVSSPSIANAYLYHFDSVMSVLAHDLKDGVYTRYSDDIVFSSSERIPESIIEEVQKELSKLKLTINQNKTHFISNLERIKLTGVRIRKDRSLGLNTTFKKAVKKEAYSFIRRAAKNQASLKELQHLQGNLAYLKMADPNYFDMLVIKYSVNGLLLTEYIKQYGNKKIKESPERVFPSLHNALRGRTLYCYIQKSRSCAVEDENEVTAMILYDGMYNDVKREIEKAHFQNNLFLPLAYFAFKYQINLELDHVYVVEVNPDDSKDGIIVENATPSVYLASLLKSSRYILAIRLPKEGKEMEIASKLLNEWRELEEYAKND